MFSIKRQLSPLLLLKMATPIQTAAVTPTYDHGNNPFVGQQIPRTWNTDHEADTRVMRHIRNKIKNLKFYLDHPLINDPHDSNALINLNRELDRWTGILNKAHYN